MVLNPFKLKQSRITVRTTKRAVEVGDVVRQFEAAYRQQYGVSPKQAQVLRSLRACRTAELGGVVYECNQCGALEFTYKPCGDRHCPKCSKFKRAEWVARQKVVLLPIPYFHVTFTTDHALNKLFAANRKVLYDSLFWAVSETLQRFAKKHLGGTVGITAVLHTWGQKMDPHVHVHCIVTGGALAEDGQRWQASPPGYLFDVVALSAAYRDRLCRRLKRLGKGGKLQAAGNDVAGLVEEIKAKKWEVFAKPFEGPEVVYEYLSRYVHQVAISNYRLLKIEQGQVHFTYHDNRDGGRKKILRLGGVEFLRRFLWHILPEGFRHIRHYGLHHPYHRKRKLQQARNVLGLEPEPPVVEKLELKAWLKEIVGAEAVDRCPHCGAEQAMVKRSEFEQLTWLQVILFALLGLSLLGTVNPRSVA